MVTTTEHRECTRSPVNAKIEVRLVNGIIVEGDAVDVSLRGLRLVTDGRLPVGKRVSTTMILESGGDQQRIEVGGQIARLDEDGVAIEFTHFDEDSIKHLRELVRYNAAD